MLVRPSTDEVQRPAIDGGAFGSAMGMTLLVPNGRGSLSLGLKGKGSDIASILRTGQGHVSARFGPGALLRFDLATFMELYGKEAGFEKATADDRTNSLHVKGSPEKLKVIVTMIEKLDGQKPDGR